MTPSGWTSLATYIDVASPSTFGFVARYHPGASVPSGNTEFQFHAAGLKFKSTSYEWLVVSGQVGISDGKLVAGGLDDELRQAIANLEALLATEGATLADVTKTTVFLRHLGSDYPRMNEVYVECFGDHRPARSAIGVADLPLGALVEVEAWAHVGAG